MKHRHTIEITEIDTGVHVWIKNLDNDGTLEIVRYRKDFDSRDEMIGDLFAGPMPNIRDCYDSDAWVKKPGRK